MLFLRFLIWNSDCPPVWWSGTIYAILKEGIIGNIHVKLFEIWTRGSVGDVIYRHFLSRALVAPFIQWTGTICAILEEGVMRKNPLKLF